MIYAISILYRLQLVIDQPRRKEMKILIIICCAFLIGSSFAQTTVKVTTTNTVATAKVQTMCPIMPKQPISKKIFADYNGKRIYFCCQGCLSAFKKDPEKYMKQIIADGVKLDDAPTTIKK